jgi:predicted amidophosphoribosyltransferase
MTAFRWRRADATDLFAHCRNHETILYARKHMSRAGYAASPTNQLIANFKMGTTAGAHRLTHRIDAMKTFINEAAALFEAFSRTHPLFRFFVIPAPTRHPRETSGWDDRLDKVVNALAQTRTNVVAFPVLETVATRQPAHETTATRSADALICNLRLVDHEMSPGPHDILTVFDDVTTSGATYEASRRLLLQRFPSSSVIGVFWAKSC